MSWQHSRETIETARGPIEVCRINGDINGNPRYVVHFLVVPTKNQGVDIGARYAEACRIANKRIGGRKYTAKWYGGGIVFQSYNLKADLEALVKQ